MLTDEVKAKLAKVYELVKRGGTEGEKTAAQKALDKLLVKYDAEGINLDALDKQLYKFTYAREMDKWLIVQVVEVLIDDPNWKEGAYYSSYGQKVVGLNLKYLDYVTVSCAYEYFKKHMKGEWLKASSPILKRCRTTKSRNAKREELANYFFGKYILKSGLYKSTDNIVTTKYEDMTAKERKVVEAMSNIEGGQYKKQVSKGLYLEA